MHDAAFVEVRVLLVHHDGHPQHRAVFEGAAHEKLSRKHRDHLDLRAEALANPGLHANQQQRMPAKIEETLIDRHRGERRGERVLVTTLADAKSRRWNGELPTETLPESPMNSDPDHWAGGIAEEHHPATATEPPFSFLTYER